MAPSYIPGSFRNRAQRSFELTLDPDTRRERRVRRILRSLQRDMDEGGRVYARQIMRGPLELFRLELEIPDMSYQRTTILDREMLETLLEETPEERIRESFRFSKTDL